MDEGEDVDEAGNAGKGGNAGLGVGEGVLFCVGWPPAPSFPSFPLPPAVHVLAGHLHDGDDEPAGVGRQGDGVLQHGAGECTELHQTLAHTVDNVAAGGAHPLTRRS